MRIAKFTLCYNQYVQISIMSASRLIFWLVNHRVVLPSMLMIAAFLFNSAARADDAAKEGFTLIELYTSHGCSSCPAADELLGNLINQDSDLIALEFHVDYWNSLVHGGNGSFTDPFSQAAFSQRQREYNAASLKGRPGVYTPQAIINGRFAAVGSNSMHITKALSRPAAQALKIDIVPTEDTRQLSIHVDGASEQKKTLAGVDVLLATYKKKAVTEITGGENKGISLTNHHIVTNLHRLGEVREAGDITFTIDSPAATDGCVVFVQEDALTPIYAAVACP